MQRIALITAAAVALAGAALPVLPSSPASAADDDGPTTISRVAAAWAGGTVTVRFDYDSWSYGRVDVLVDDEQAGSAVLPDFASGTRSVRIHRAVSAGPAHVDVRITSCDDADPDALTTTCATRTAWDGTVLPVTRAPKHQASAVALLDSLRVGREAHAGDYRRSRFRLWVDADGDGASTRTEVLSAESARRITMRHGSVRTGRWISLYDGKRFTSAARLDIDHIVPLAEAWRSGASAWSARKREAYANDLGYRYSLIAVSAQQNRSKGDRDPASWMPERASYACRYAKEYIAVKSRWRLGVDRDEKAALTTHLASCDSMFVAKPGVPRLSKLVHHAAPKPKPKPKPHASAPKPARGGTDPNYGTCTELQRHPNHAPYVRGVDREYAWYQDRDHDGVVCE